MTLKLLVMLVKEYERMLTSLGDLNLKSRFQIGKDLVKVSEELYMHMSIWENILALCEVGITFQAI